MANQKRISGLVLNTLFIAFTFFQIPIFAQDYLPNKEEIERFFTTKTMVVLEENPMSEFNLAAKEVFEKDWKITPHEFIKYADFEAKRNDPQYSFLMINQVRYEKDKTKSTYNYISLLLGSSDKFVSNMPDLCSFPLSYSGVDEDHYNYKLATILRFIQYHVQIIRQNPEIIKENVFKHYNDNIGDIHGKTLYLVKEELAKEINSEAKIKKLYGSKFKIVTREQLEEIINNGDEDAVFLHKVGPEGTNLDARVYKLILGVADNKMYYFDYHKQNEKNQDAFLDSDLKKIAKTKKKE